MSFGSTNRLYFTNQDPASTQAMQDEINVLKSENRSNIAMIEQLNRNITILSGDIKVSFLLDVEFVS